MRTVDLELEKSVFETNIWILNYFNLIQDLELRDNKAFL